MTYFKVKDLAKYVASEYYNKYTRNISGLKLQKTLYFLFAYWAGFVKRGEGQDSELEVDLRQYLFDEKIEAWTYGPVIPEVYHNSEEIVEARNFAFPNIENKEFIKAFIDDMLVDIFKISDFKLVEISHQDNCWKNNYNNYAITHNREITKEEIANEYSRQS